MPLVSGDTLVGRLPRLLLQQLGQCPSRLQPQRSADLAAAGWELHRAATVKD